MTALDQLKASAPRTFDKILVDLLVAIQQGERPIQLAEPAPVLVPSVREERVIQLEREVQTLAREVWTLREALRALRDIAEQDTREAA